MPHATRLSSVGALVLAAATLATFACANREDAPADAAHQEYWPTATIKDLMQSVVDPSADVVWLSVNTVHTTAGTVETAPATNEEWEKVRHGAIALVEAANLLVVPGRHVARPGERSETPGVELEPEEMEALIAKDPVTWRQHAKDLHDAAEAVLQAIDTHDAERVFEVGERIERACESCHRQYWYPNEEIPPLPSAP